MTFVNTILGQGKIVQSESSRGKTEHLVEGVGFSRWFTAGEIFIPDEIDQSKDEGVNEDNSTVLPYNPNPQHTIHTLPDEATLQPIYEIDSDERLEDTDSLGVEQIANRLGPKFVKLKESTVDRDSDYGRLLSDPERYAYEFASNLPPVDSSNQKMANLLTLLDSDSQIREAAWIDVQAKAKRLRSTGKVSVKEITPRAIHASVVGDHGTYDSIVVRGGAVLGAGSITEWACACEWGRWAFIRRDRFAGRLCSHGLAAYTELQRMSRLELNKDLKKNKKRRNPALLPYRNSSVNEEESSPISLLEAFYEWADDWANPYELEEFIAEKDINRQNAMLIDQQIMKLEEYSESGGTDFLGFIQDITGPAPDGDNYIPETHYVAREDVTEDSRSFVDDEGELDFGDDYDVEEDGRRVARSETDFDTGFFSQVFTDAQGNETGVIYNPLDQIVDRFEPQDGIMFERGEEDDALNSFVNSLSDEEVDSAQQMLVEANNPLGFDELEVHKPFSGSGWRETLHPETSLTRSEREDEFEDVEELSDGSNRTSNMRVAGRIFSFPEQMALINEAQGDDEILSRLDLKNTHYEGLI